MKPNRRERRIALHLMKPKAVLASQCLEFWVFRGSERVKYLSILNSNQTVSLLDIYIKQEKLGEFGSEKIHIQLWKETIGSEGRNYNVIKI